MVGQFLFVKDNLQLGTVLVTADVTVASSGHIGLHATDEFLGKLIRLVEVVAVYLDAQTVVAATHAAFRDNYAVELGVLGKFLTQHLLHLENGEVEELINVGFHFARGFQSLLDAGAALQFGCDTDTAVVLVFHKVHANLACEERDERGYEDSKGHEEGDALVVEGPGEHAGIPALDGSKPLAEGILPAEGFLLVFALVLFLFQLGEEEGLLFQQQAGKHRNERDGGSGGDAHHDGDNPAKFLEEDACHARQHGEGYEHRHDDQGGGNDRGPHLIGGVDGCLARTLAAFNMLGDVFQHHDGIVHHHADGHGERCQGDDVQRTVGQ